MMQHSALEKEILKLVGAHSPSRLVMVAMRLGLFEAIARGPATAAGLARGIGLDADRTGRVLNALVSLGLVRKRGDRYGLTPALQATLTRDGRRSLVRTITLYDAFWEVWGGLDRSVKTGRPVIPIMELIRRRPGLKRDFIHGMADRAALAARMIADRVDLRRARSLIDIGAGPGVYALEWARAHPRLTATVYDIRSVLPITRRYIRRYGLARRVRTRAGDFNTDPIGNGYDLALLANVLQMHGPEECAALIQKVYRALHPGGRVILHGFMTDDTGTRPPESALFAVTIGLVTPRGNAHPVSETLRWLRDAGFRRPRRFEIDVVPSTVLVAERG